MKHTHAATIAASLMVLAALAGCSSSSSSKTTSSKTTNAGSVASSCSPAHANVKTLTKGTLQVLVYVSPPYTFQNGDSFTGVDGTIIKKLAQMECLRLSEKSVAPAALVASVQDKRADLAIGGIYYTAQRAQTFALSTPMYRDGMALLSKASLDGTLEGLKGKSVGVVQGYLWDADLQKALGTGNVKLYQSSAGMIADLKNGRLSVGVLTSAEAGYRAKHDASLKVTQMQPTPEVAASKSKNDVVLLMVKDETSLASAFDGDIKTLLNNGTIKSALSANGMDPSLAGGTTS